MEGRGTTYSKDGAFRILSDRLACHQLPTDIVKEVSATAVIARYIFAETYAVYFGLHIGNDILGRDAWLDHNDISSGVLLYAPLLSSGCARSK